MTHAPTCTCRPCAIQEQIDNLQRDEVLRIEAEAQAIVAAGGKPLVILRRFPDRPLVVDEKDAPDWAPHDVEGKP